MKYQENFFWSGLKRGLVSHLDDLSSGISPCRYQCRQYPVLVLPSTDKRGEHGRSNCLLGERSLIPTLTVFALQTVAVLSVSVYTCSRKRCFRDSCLRVFHAVDVFLADTIYCVVILQPFDFLVPLLSPPLPLSPAPTSLTFLVLFVEEPTA